MFDDTNTSSYIDSSPPYVSAEFSFKEIILGCEKLPANVRRAPFTVVEERRITRRLLNHLCGPEHTDESGESLARLARRHDALSGYLHKELVCVFVRLPGIHYTIEIDPVTQQVAYWEWQAKSGW